MTAMILTRCIRQFETPEGVIELAKVAVFSIAPTMGTKLRFTDEGQVRGWTPEQRRLVFPNTQGRATHHGCSLGASGVHCSPRPA